MTDTNKNLHITTIQRKISELQSGDLKTILSFIMQSSIEDEKIHEKGSGTEIRYSDMSSELIEKIYNFILAKDVEKNQQLDYC